MTRLIKAKRIASEWHGGQWSALYQFASSGVFVPANTLQYFQEIETCLHPEYNLHPGFLTKKEDKELNEVKEFLLNEAKNNGFPVVFVEHKIYGYQIPYLDESVPQSEWDKVKQLRYAI